MLADAPGSGPGGPRGPYGFESHLPHQNDSHPRGGWLWHISTRSSATVPVRAVGACSVRRDRCSDHRRGGRDMEMHGCSPAEPALAHAAADTLRRRRRPHRNTVCAGVSTRSGETFMGLDLASRKSSACAEPAAIAAAHGRRIRHHRGRRGGSEPCGRHCGDLALRRVSGTDLVPRTRSAGVVARRGGPGSGRGPVRVPRDVPRPVAGTGPGRRRRPTGDAANTTSWLGSSAGRAPA